MAPKMKRKRNRQVADPVADGTEHHVGERREADVLAHLDSFIARYGCKPGPKHPLGAELKGFKQCSTLQDRLKHLPRLLESTRNIADGFLAAVETCDNLKKWKGWTKSMRRRVPLCESALKKCLEAHAPQGQHRPVTLKKRPSAAVDQPTTLMPGNIVHAAIAYIPCKTANGVIPLTPPSVANWLYQAVVDTMGVLQSLLGDGKFTADGRLVPGSGLGEAVLWRGTHLGCARDQAMIAWDYDADLAVFTADGVNFDAVWKLAEYKLSAFGYVLSQHGEKYRVSPKEA